MTARTFLQRALATAERAATTQDEPIAQAARTIADTIAGGGTVWAFGTGHSHAIAEEIYGRAGGLRDVRAILEPALMLHEGLQKSSLVERLPGYAELILEIWPVRDGDMLIVVSNSGRNAVPVQLAELAVDRGIPVVAITSLAHSRAVTSRAPSGRRLFEVADVVVDTCGVPGDAVVEVEGHPGLVVGPTSTVVGALLAQAIVVEAAHLLAVQGVRPDVLTSLNIDSDEVTSS